MNNLFSIRRIIRSNLGDNPDRIATSKYLQLSGYETIPLIASIVFSHALKSPLAKQEDKAIAFKNKQPKKPHKSLWLLTILLTFWLSPHIRSYWSQFTDSKTATDSSQDNFDNVLPVETMTVTAQNHRKIWRSYTGVLVARRQSSLSLRRLGKITQIMVEEGDRVTAGTPLATLDTSKLLAKQQELLAKRKQLVARLQDLESGSRQETIEVARLNLENLQTQLKLSLTKQQRRQQLYDSGAISLELLNEATTQAQSDRLRVRQAQKQLDELLAGARPQTVAAQQAAIEQLDASLASLKVDLDQSTLKAPFTGIVAQRLLDEGTVVNPGQPILSLVEAERPEARIGVPVGVANRIIPGSQQQLQIGFKTYQAKVMSIAPQLDTNSRTVSVILQLEDSLQGELKSGQIAKLQIAETIDESGYWLPTSALAKGVRGLWTCYVLGQRITESGQTAFNLEPRELEVLHTEGDRVFVRGTLQNSDRVIVNGTHRLVPGLLVQPELTN